MTNSVLCWPRILAATLSALLLLQISDVAAQQWVPPTDPDPETIRNEAAKDAQIDPVLAHIVVGQAHLWAGDPEEGESHLLRFELVQCIHLLHKMSSK